MRPDAGAVFRGKSNPGRVNGRPMWGPQPSLLGCDTASNWSVVPPKRAHDRRAGMTLEEIVRTTAGYLWRAGRAIGLTRPGAGLNCGPVDAEARRPWCELGDLRVAGVGFP